MRRALMVACLLPSFAWADTLPSSVLQARERMEQEPEYYDHADQFCAEKRVGSPCVIPGNPFEGGGLGICRTWASRDGGAIESRCTLTYRSGVLGTLPDSTYQAPESMCENGEAKQSYAQLFRHENATCGVPTVISDKYCGGKHVGDDCIADVRSGASVSSYPGICLEKQDLRGRYYYGRVTLRRTVLTCSPEKPVIINIRESSPPNWLRRLLE